LSPSARERVHHLVFLQQPTNTSAGQTISAVIAEVVDQFGNVLTSDNSDTVTVALHGWLKAPVTAAAPPPLPPLFPEESAADLASSSRQRQRRWSWRVAGLLLGVFLLSSFLLSSLWYILRPQHFSPTETQVASKPPRPTAEVASQPPLDGWIDVRVWKKDKLLGPGQWLGPHVLPFKPGDEVRVEAELKRPAYLYVVWLDTTGKPLPTTR
jgi:hypothetical protein